MILFLVRVMFSKNGYIASAGLRPSLVRTGKGKKSVDLPHLTTLTWHARPRCSTFCANDLPIGSENTDRDRHVEFFALGIDDIGEQEGLAIFLIDSAAKLPADQRMHLGILVDLPIDRNQQTRLIQRLQMIM